MDSHDHSSYTDRDGESFDFITVQECLPLDSMGTMVIVHGMIPADLYDEALPFINDLTGEISIDFG